MALSDVSAGAKVTLAGVTAGEWLKLRQQRGFIWASLSALCVCVAVSALAGSLLREEYGKNPTGAFDLASSMPSSSAFIVALLFCLGLCVWLAAEFVGGSNYLTLLAIPRRRLVFTARLALVSLLSLLFGGVVVLIGTASGFLFVGSTLMLPVMSGNGYWMNALLTIVVSLCTALLGFSAAMLTRRSLSAVGILAVLFFVLPNIEGYLTFSRGPELMIRILGSLPGSLVSQALMGSSAEATSTYSAMTAAALLVSWSALLVAVVAWRFAKYE